MVSPHLPRHGGPSVWFGSSRGKTSFEVLSRDGHIFLSLDAMGSPGEGLSSLRPRGINPHLHQMCRASGIRGNRGSGGGVQDPDSDVSQLCTQSSVTSGQACAFSALSFPLGKRKESDQVFGGWHLWPPVVLGDSHAAAYIEFLPWVGKELAASPAWGPEPGAALT